MSKTKKTKKAVRIIIISILGLLLAFIVVCAVVLYGRIATISSASKVEDGLYKIDYKQEYDLDKALSSDINSTEKLLSFISDEFYFGYNFSGNADEYACSAFLTKTPGGKYAAGRNFDHGWTDVLVVHTSPKDGYDSISTAALDMLGVGSTNGTEALSFSGRLSMLASPYICVDGMNEKGLNVSILNLDKKELHQDSGKPDILVTVALRMLLDRAADVDQAVELLGKYDMQMMERVSQHLFIADKSGKAVVVEWTKDKMEVTDSNVCTNFELAPEGGKYKGLCDRFDKITDQLAEHPENTAEEAMGILESVSMTAHSYGSSTTQWSCVFDLDDYSVKYVVGSYYDDVQEIRPDDF